MLKKSSSIIFLYFLFPLSLFATVQEDILKDINASFSQSKLNDNMITTLSIEDIENNQSIMSEIDAYLKILPRYLDYSPIITGTLQQYDSIGNLDTSLNFSYHKMFTASLLHLKTLNPKNNYLYIQNILVAHLQNSYALMTKTDNFVNYMMALSHYDNTYTYIEKNPQYSSILLKNHPPKLTEFRYLNEREKLSLFKMTKHSLLREEDIKQSGVGYEQLMNNTIETFQKKYEEYDKKFFNAIYSNSPKAMQKFKNYLDNEQKELLSFSSKFSFFYEGLKAKIQNRLGFEADTKGMATYIGKTLVLVAYPKGKESIYIKHKKLLIRYKNLLQKYDRQ